MSASSVIAFLYSVQSVTVQTPSRQELPRDGDLNLREIPLIQIPFIYLTLPRPPRTTDNGEGHVGTVREIGRQGSSNSPDKTVVVNWDSGNRTNYRVGYQDQFDLIVVDNAQIGTC